MSLGSNVPFERNAKDICLHTFSSPSRVIFFCNTDLNSSFEKRNCLNSSHICQENFLVCRFLAVLFTDSLAIDLGIPEIMLD